MCLQMSVVPLYPVHLVVVDSIQLDLFCNIEDVPQLIQALSSAPVRIGNRSPAFDPYR